MHYNYEQPLNRNIVMHYTVHTHIKANGKCGPLPANLLVYDMSRGRMHPV